jgi:hypothetical protein
MYYFPQKATGSDIRQIIVSSIRRNGYEPDNKYILALINDKKVQDKFFYHIERNYTTFSSNTKKILLKVMIRLQEEAISESMKWINTFQKNSFGGFKSKTSKRTKKRKTRKRKKSKRKLRKN